MTGSFVPLIDLLISLLTAIHHVYKPLIHNLNHKMIENNLDFYLEDITESTRNTNRIKELRGIKNNQIFHVRQNSTQKFYQYRLDKIGKFKGYLRCIDYKCNSRLEVIFGLEMFMGIKAFQLHMMNEKKVWGKTKSKGKRKKHLIEKHNIMRYCIREFDRLSETEQKNKLISHCLKLSGARKIVFQKDYDEPCDSDADYDSDPDSEAETDFDYNSDPE